MHSEECAGRGRPAARPSRGAWDPAGAGPPGKPLTVPSSWGGPERLPNLFCSPMCPAPRAACGHSPSAGGEPARPARVWHVDGRGFGPNLTTVGSLATMLRLLILRRRGLEVSSVDYFRVGIVTTPGMLVAAALA